MEFWKPLPSLLFHVETLSTDLRNTREDALRILAMIASFNCERTAEARGSVGDFLFNTILYSYNIQYHSRRHRQFYRVYFLGSWAV